MVHKSISVLNILIYSLIPLFPYILIHLYTYRLEFKVNSERWQDRKHLDEIDIWLESP